MDALTFLDRQAVARLLPRATCFELARRAFEDTSLRRGQQPNRVIIPIPKPEGAVLSVMAGVMHHPISCGAKISAVYPENRRRGLAGHNGIVVVFDPSTGRPTGVLHGGELTARRTAAATAVATRALARANSRVLALIGAGEQAQHHLEALLDCMSIERVRVWSRTPARASSFTKAYEGVGVELTVHERIESLVAGADVICTLTSAPDPILFGPMLEPGQHLNAVGSSVQEFREIDEDVVRRSRVFADYLPMMEAEGGDYRAALNSGAIAPGHAIGEIGEVLLGQKPGRTAETDITLFKSLGIIAEDLTAAYHALECGSNESAGTRVPFE
jgi:ornithine cyclodeaminase/alanine dehydrogenase-like protein (mu-crystallin family)